MNIVQSITVDTPDGIFHILIDEKEVARASGFGDLKKLAERLPRELLDAEIVPVADHVYERHVQDYFNGSPTALNAIPRSQIGSEFQMDVWNAISTIPYGQTISYKELAKKAGRPEAIRAAGTICGLNRLILLVPCHRILKSDGGIGNYLYGVRIKESLLKRERVTG